MSSKQKQGLPVKGKGRSQNTPHDGTKGTSSRVGGSAPKNQGKQNSRRNASKRFPQHPPKGAPKDSREGSSFNPANVRKLVETVWKETFLFSSALTLGYITVPALFLVINLAQKVPIQDFQSVLKHARSKLPSLNGEVRELTFTELLNVVFGIAGAIWDAKTGTSDFKNEIDRVRKEQYNDWNVDHMHEAYAHMSEIIAKWKHEDGNEDKLYGFTSHLMGSVPAWSNTKEFGIVGAILKTITENSDVTDADIDAMCKSLGVKGGMCRNKTLCVLCVFIRCKKSYLLNDPSFKWQNIVTCVLGNAWSYDKKFGKTMQNLACVCFYAKTFGMNPLQMAPYLAKEIGMNKLDNSEVEKHLARFKSQDLTKREIISVLSSLPGSKDTNPLDGLDLESQFPVDPLFQKATQSSETSKFAVLKTDSTGNITPVVEKTTEQVPWTSLFKKEKVQLPADTHVVVSAEVDEDTGKISLTYAQVVAKNL